MSSIFLQKNEKRMKFGDYNNEKRIKLFFGQEFPGNPDNSLELTEST